MEGCFSLLLSFDHALPLDFDSALVRGEDIIWIFLTAPNPIGKGAFVCWSIQQTVGQTRTEMMIVMRSCST
tara:strand:+ start:79 stop:291 length:213 start_codon:yes stop_codon:yes gene_type:complete